MVQLEVLSSTIPGLDGSLANRQSEMPEEGRRTGINEMLGNLTAVLQHCLEQTPNRSNISVLDVTDAVDGRSVLNLLSSGRLASRDRDSLQSPAYQKLYDTLAEAGLQPFIGVETVGAQHWSRTVHSIQVNAEALRSYVIQREGHAPDQRPIKINDTIPNLDGAFRASNPLNQEMGRAAGVGQMVGDLEAILQHCLEQTPNRSNISVLDVTDAVDGRSVLNLLSSGRLASRDRDSLQSPAYQKLYDTLAEAGLQPFIGVETVGAQHWSRTVHSIQVNAEAIAAKLNLEHDPKVSFDPPARLLSGGSKVAAACEPNTPESVIHYESSQ